MIRTAHVLSLLLFAAMPCFAAAAELGAAGYYSSHEGGKSCIYLARACQRSPR
jgi:hypothetical protein